MVHNLQPQRIRYRGFLLLHVPQPSFGLHVRPWDQSFPKSSPEKRAGSTIIGVHFVRKSETSRQPHGPKAFRKNDTIPSDESPADSFVAPRSRRKKGIAQMCWQQSPTFPHNPSTLAWNHSQSAVLPSAPRSTPDLANTFSNLTASSLEKGCDLVLWSFRRRSFPSASFSVLQKAS